MSGHGEPEAMDEPLLEADVLGVAEPAVGVERRRVVGADVEDDLVAGPQQLRGHGAGHGRREARGRGSRRGSGRCPTTAEPRRRADDVRAGGGDELAVDAHAVVDAVGDRLDGSHDANPSWYSRLRSPISAGSSRCDRRGVRPERAPGRPTSGPSAGRGRRGSCDSTAAASSVRRGEVGRPRPDHVAQDASIPSGSPITNSGCGVGPLYSSTSATSSSPSRGDAPAGPGELAVLEVADRVGGEEPVVLEEARAAAAGPWSGRRDDRVRAVRARRWPSAVRRQPGRAARRPDGSGVRRAPRDERRPRTARGSRPPR